MDEGIARNIIYRARRMREIRRYDGEVNSKFLEDNRPSMQGSREYPKACSKPEELGARQINPNYLYPNYFEFVIIWM
jgi:hypothetical protein